MAHAFLIGADFLAGYPTLVVLGDNLFNGHLVPQLVNSNGQKQGVMVLAYPIPGPSHCSEAEFDGEGRVLSLEEKPKQPRSRYANGFVLLRSQHPGTGPPGEAFSAVANSRSPNSIRCSWMIGCCGGISSQKYFESEGPEFFLHTRRMCGSFG